MKNENTTDAPTVFYTDCTCEYCKAAKNRAAKQTVEQTLQAEIRELKLERDSLKRKVEAANSLIVIWEGEARSNRVELIRLKRKVEAAKVAMARVDDEANCVWSREIAAAALKEMEGE